MKLSLFTFARTILSGTAAVLLATAVSCSEEPAAPLPDEDSTEQEDSAIIEIPQPITPDVDLISERPYITAYNEFAANLYKKLSAVRASQEENLFVSPYSVATALGILANGADGATREEIVKALGYEDFDLETINAFNARMAQEFASVDPFTTMSLSNAAWFHNTLNVKADFLKSCTESYGMDAKTVDLYSNSTLNEINSWAKEKTNGLIDRILDQPLSQPDLMCIANAIYFQAPWRCDYNFVTGEEKLYFKKEDSHEGTFHNVDGTTSTVTMMHGFVPNSFGTGLEKGLVLRIPFGNGNYHFYFIYPDEGYTIAELIEEYSGTNLHTWQNYIEGKTNLKINLTIDMPRFDIASDMDNLRDALSDLGIVRAFTPGMADFSNITNQELCISLLKQKSFLKLNEDGAEIGAITGELGYGMGIPPDDFELEINRPFGFFISEVFTETVLFMGEVNKL